MASLYTGWLIDRLPTYGVSNNRRRRSTDSSPAGWDMKLDKGDDVLLRTFSVICSFSTHMEHRSASADARHAYAAADVDIGPFRINAEASQGILIITICWSQLTFDS